jgi:arylsulfatase A-like enzyme
LDDTNKLTFAMKITRKYLLVLLLAFIGITSLFAQKTQPNVILIIADDHGYADMNHLGIHGNLKTPNLDTLATEGISLTQAYVTSPICSPSRTGLITGQWQTRNNNYFYGGPGIARGTKTIAQGFKKNGYVTAYFGKLHYGSDDGPTAYNYPANHGFDECITAGYGGRVHYLYHNEKAIAKHSKTAEPWLKNGKKLEEDGFSTEQISKWSQQFIENNRDKPFFLQIAFNAVHNFNFQLPPEYLKEWNLPYYPDYGEVGETIKESEWYDQSIIPNLPNGRAYYIAQLFYLDREIGTIREKLKTLGLDENTIIVYTSDNGGSNCNGGDNTPLNSTKYSLYEGGIRVPMIMYWKNRFAPNSLKNKMVSTLDLMPTLLSAANADADTYENTDGLNLLPYLLNDKEMERDELVWDVGFAWALRKGKWKLKVVTDQAKADKISKKQHTVLGKGIELFDLDADMSEQHNLADEYPKVVEELTALYTHWKRMVTK